MHVLCDNCNAYAERNVLFFPLLKVGMRKLIDLRLILLLFLVLMWILVLLKFSLSTG